MDVHENSQLDYEEKSTDYVKWQGSQTACLALNQLIKSSANEPQVVDERVSTSRGWQRQPSFDQIPGFSLLSTQDTDEFSPQASSSSSKSLRPSLSRPRSSNVGTRSPAIPSDVPNADLPIPFLGKANPSLFIDMLKGVSAHLDKNVGVHSVKGSGPIQGARATKRPRLSSLGNTSDPHPGNIKRGRVSAPHELEGHVIRALDKGKAKSNGTDTPLVPLQANVASSNAHLNERTSTNSRDIENMASNSWTPHHQSSSKTASQSKMPPPALPNKYSGPTASSSRNHSSASSSTMSSATSSVSHAQSSHSISRTHTTAIDSKTPKAESGPKLHPPLLAQNAKPASSSSLSSKPPIHPPVPPRVSPSIASAKPQAVSATSTSKPHLPDAPQPKHPPSEYALPSSTPKPSSSQSTRPPALGMRRINALPSAGISTTLKTTGALPTKRKGFKPPLLSASQTPLSQAAPPSQAYVHRAPPTCSSGSTSSESLRASASSFGSSVPRSASPASASQSPPALRRKGITTAASVKRAEAERTMPVSPTLPEPLDGDGDSSFGDMSFDMDALEETMRLYD